MYLIALGICANSLEYVGKQYFTELCKLVLNGFFLEDLLKDDVRLDCELRMATQYMIMSLEVTEPVLRVLPSPLLCTHPLPPAGSEFCAVHPGWGGWLPHPLPAAAAPQAAALVLSGPSGVALTRVQPV